MIAARLAPDAQPHKQLQLDEQFPRTPGERNDAWIHRAIADPRFAAHRGPLVLLIGGAALSHFRVRVAQSHARSDMLPSYWSHVALLVPGDPWTLTHVPLATADLDDMPGRNAIATAALADFADPRRYPNLAVLSFGEVAGDIAAILRALRPARLSDDFVSPIVAWLAFVWGTSSHTNPLLAGVPLPAAQFISAVFSATGLDITPGLSDRVTCPEAIWQAALWWSNYYESHPGGSRLPICAHVLGQPAAAADDFKDLQRAPP